jgi:hypothetical protein
MNPRTPFRIIDSLKNQERAIVLMLMAASWMLAWLVRDPFVSDWDGFDYAAHVIEATPSPLGLGRALFLAYNRFLFLTAQSLFGLTPPHLPTLMKFTVIALSGLATAGLLKLFHEITREFFTAVMATLLVVLSPIYIIWSGRGMSEIPGVMMFAWTLWWMMHSAGKGGVAQFVMAAILFGLSANVREFALFYLPLIPFLARRMKWNWTAVVAVSAAAVLAAFAGPIFWMLKRPEYYLPALQSWYALSAQERREHPVTIRNLWMLPGYMFLCSPACVLISLATAKQAIALRREQVARLLSESSPSAMLLGLCGIFSMMVLLLNHDLALNPRYLLTGLLGMAPLCASLLTNHLHQHRQQRRALPLAAATLTLLSLLGVFVFLYAFQWPRTIAARGYLEKTDGLPNNAVFIVGRNSALIDFYRRIGTRPDWRVIAFGSAWPDEKISEVIDAHLRQGRSVYVDFDPQLWDKTMRDHSREAAGLERIRQQYQLILVRDSLMQIQKR